MKVRAKICGLKTQEAIEVAQNNGAEFLGFIFAKDSPRYITPKDAGKVGKVATAKKVAVVVDPSDELLQEIIHELKPAYIQLHGNESKERAQEIKDRFNLPLIRAIRPNENPANDGLYDYFLVDSPFGGGSGKTFDWEAFQPPSGEWFLSGGLTAKNVAKAVKTTGAKMVDVSSGVESKRGVKDLAKIKEFLQKISTLN